MVFDILLGGLTNGITSLPVFISVLAPFVFTFNWMFIQKDAGRHHDKGQLIHSDLPNESELTDDSWYFAFQDHAVQLYTFFLGWVALLYQGATAYFDITANQSWADFNKLVETLHWSIELFSKSIWYVFFGCFFLGACLFGAGVFSKINIVAKYKYSRPPDLKRLYFPTWRSPITIGRFIIVMIAILFNIWLETLRVTKGLAI